MKIITNESIKAMSKSELRNLVEPPISRKYLRKVVNDIISNKRKISLEEAKKQKMIFKTEIQEILTFLGFI